MDESVARKFVNEHCRILADCLGLDDWTLFVEIESLEGNTAADCLAQGEYRYATIRFDAAKVKDEDTLLDRIAHELFHVIHWPFDMYRNVTNERLAGNDSELALNRELSRNAVEMIVANLMKIWRLHLREAYLEFYTAS